MKKILTLFLFMFAFTFVNAQTAQNSSLPEIHSAMIYNFVKYVQWPNTEKSDFVLAVYGDEEIYNILHQRYNDKPKSSQKMKVIFIKNIADVANCDVVYISKSKNKDFAKIKEAISTKPILTITDSQNLGQQGSCINLKVVDQKMKFEVNEDSFNANGLKISSQLTSMAIMIKVEKL